MNHPHDFPIYLASSSPRRAKLLRDAGWNFQQVTPPYDDTGADLGPACPIRTAEALAYLKAASLADTLDFGLVIGCDTLIIHDDKKLGKPTDAHHARAMLESLFDAPHKVVSAVALVDPVHHRMLFHDTTMVTIHRPDDGSFEQYLQSHQWGGKAGGYNLAELQDQWRFDVEGDPTTVIGLPMRLLHDRVDHFLELIGAQSA